MTKRNIFALANTTKPNIILLNQAFIIDTLQQIKNDFSGSI